MARRDELPIPDPGVDIIELLPPGPERDYFIAQRAGQQSALLMPKLPERHRAKVDTIPLPPELASWDWTEGGPLLHGPRGTGKTQAATTLVYETVKSRRHQANDVAFISTSMLFVDMRRAIDDKTLKPQGLEQMRQSRLVVLEDLGKERPSEWVAEQMFVICDDLYAREVDLIVTTNYQPHELEARVGEFAADRIAEMTRPFLLDGSSYRRENQ